MRNMNYNPCLHFITAFSVMVALVLILQGEFLQVEISLDPVEILLLAITYAKSSGKGGKGKDG